MERGEVRVWDPLVRLFHWGLVAAMAVAFVSEDWERLHMVVGLAAAALVAFRLVWGLIGPRHARFSDFVKHPGAVVAYVKDVLTGQAPRHLGHNPAGGAMILALLAAVAIVAATGWLAQDGPHWLEEFHEVAAFATLGLIALHVTGVAVSSLLHGENLVRAMVTGRKRAD